MELYNSRRRSMPGPPFEWNLRKTICEEAQQSSPTEAPCAQCSLLFNTPGQPFQGGESDVYALIDHTGQAICFRLSRASGEVASYLVQQQIDHLKAVEELELKHYPRLLGYCISNENVFGRPYTLLSWAPGSSLIWTKDVPVIEARKRVIAGVAKATVDLLRVQRTGGSAKKHMETLIRRKMDRASRNEYRGGDVQSCQEQLDLLDRYWIPELDELPFVLVHGDLGANNIVADEEGNLESIIDFGWAQMMPLQFAAVFPRFLTHEPVERGDDAWDLTWRHCKNEVMDRDRGFYLDCVKAIAGETEDLVARYCEILCRSDEVNRYWWLRSVFEPKIHRAMVACGWDAFGDMMSESEEQT